ncbi:hypothetical protein A2U01_0052210 [Trifolium medium]|uniref:Uncharacterized protein n=1 Tax=Trifolium medium TaxID=97028 RepID=A0A392R442_9FABA|nr:hypothetical protein [Trifolium medium]
MMDVSEVEESFFAASDAKLENQSDYQSFVGPVVIDAGLGREDHGLISGNCDRDEAGTT